MTHTKLTHSISVLVLLCCGSFAFGQTVATPTFTPDGATFNLEQSVRVDCATAGATINYTTNGVDPTSSDRPIVSGSSVLVDHPITLKARATKTGMSPSAVKSSAFNIVGKMAAGQNHSLVVKTDATIWAWGSNASGQLGRGSTSSSPLPNPAQVKTNSTTFLTSVLTVAGGAAHSVAAKTDGTMWAWGSNVSGQIGDGTTTQRLYATQVKLTGGAAFTGAIDVVSGSDHCVALKSDGTVWAWGLNFSGQVGNGTTTTPQKNPVQVKVTSTTFLTGVVAIAAGNTHSLALKSDGTIWAWGLNSSGQLGNTNTTNQSFAVQVKVAGGAAFTGGADVAAGANHSLAKKTDGTLWSWGSNANGQLADGTTNPTSTSKQTNAVQVKASATTFFTAVTAMAGGASHTTAIKSDGTLWSWGLNSSNQLGDGTSTQRVFPVQVKDTSGTFITGIVDLFDGASHSLATKSDGTAWGWGLNSLGQTGSTNTSLNPNLATKIVIGTTTVLAIIAMDDPDRDGLPTWQERELGTNPNSSDTDADGMPDNYEIGHGLNPVVNDGNGDLDNDGFTNSQEYTAGTNPQNPDSDGDTVRDGDDIYPLDVHFALKKQPLNTYAVVEIGGGGGSVKMNNFNMILSNQRYLNGVDLGFTAVDLNDNGQVIGNKDYSYLPDRFQMVIQGRSLHHAVVTTGPGTVRDLGDGTVDNSHNDITGDPTIDGTNQAESTAFAIGNPGMIVGTTYFYVDVTPPVNQGDPSQITFSDYALARLDGGPPSSRFTGPTVTPTAINDAGDIAGYIGSIGGNCALWNGSTNVSLPFFHYPYKVNQDRYVAGAQWQPNNRYPLVWHDTETKYLPTPFNTKDAEVYSINKDGIMVGYAYSNVGAYSAILWQNGTYYNMNTQLNAAAVTAGYTVSTLWAVNDHGTICASASKPGWAGFVLLVPDPAVQLITPGGDPLNAPVDTAVDGQNEFTFNSSNPGVLSIHFKAKVLAPGTAAALASRCRFSIDNIPGSTFDWAQANPNGQPTNPSGDFLEADATFTGLPTSNSGFGRKNVTITVDGVVRDRKLMEVFFPKNEKNHPGPDNGVSWNWFYYWNQTTAGNPYAKNQNYGSNFGVTPAMAFWSNSMTYDKREIWICDTAQFSDTRRDGSGQLVTGIDLFANVVAHETRHTAQIADADAVLGNLNGRPVSIWLKGWSWNTAPNNHWSLGFDGGAGVASVDDDGDVMVDEINDNSEIGFTGSDDVNLDTNFDDVPDAFSYTNVETDAGKAETISEDSHLSEDWAHPGKQYQTTSYSD